MKSPDIDYDSLRGTTLRVYWMILKADKPIRAGEVQRELRLSSPSVADYHLKKLLNMKLLREEGGGYVVDRILIDDVWKIGKHILPYQVAYVTYFGIMLVASLSVGKNLIGTTFGFLALCISVSAVIVSTFELLETIRRLERHDSL